MLSTSKAFASSHFLGYSLFNEGDNDQIKGFGGKVSGSRALDFVQR
jgi:hypothetical protein